MNKHTVEYIQLSLGDKCPVLKASQSMISPPEKSANQWQSHASRRHPISLCSLQPPILKVEASQQPYSSESRNTLEVLQFFTLPLIYIHQSFPAHVVPQNLPKALALFWKRYKYSSPLQVNMKFTLFTADIDYNLLLVHKFSCALFVMHHSLLCIWCVTDVLWDDQIQL